MTTPSASMRPTPPHKSAGTWSRFCGTLRAWTIVLALLSCLGLVACACLTGCRSGTNDDPDQTDSAKSDAATGGTTTLVDSFHNPDLGNGWQAAGSLELTFARCFTVDFYEGGYQLACLKDGSRYLVVPEGVEAPADLASDIVVLYQPLDTIYLAASDSMCLFDALDALDAIAVSGIERDGWYIASAREAMDEGRIVYGGKYRSPDYELLVAKGVDLAVESSMINHTPEVREKLTELGIPVLTELSSYEDEPLGRAEWIKLYGALLGREQQAQELFDRQVAQVSSLTATPSNKTVVFFYLNSNGAAVVRRPGDYVTKMIEQAGGVYAFNNLDGAKAGASSVTIQMEAFYAEAKDADVLIYNSSIDGGVNSLDDLLARSELFSDFKAVQEGNVWVTEQNMYQQMLDAGVMISDINGVLCGRTDNLTYLRPLT